jgi:hypothetical protein
VTNEADGRQPVGSPEAAIRSLASELQVPVDQVERAYLREARAIGAGARIKSYVAVLTASRVRSELRRRQRPS